MKYNYHAIALEKFNIGEADRLYTFYTLEEGLIRVPAKSSRKGKSKMASQIEDFMLSHITIAKNYGQGILAGAVAEEYFSDLRSNFAALKCLDEVRQIFLLIIQENDNDKGVFAIFVQYLKELNKLSKKKSEDTNFLWITDVFLIKLFDYQGYCFYINKCGNCGGKIMQRQSKFSAGHSGILCEKCRCRENFCNIDPDTIKAIRAIYGNNLEALSRLKVNKDVCYQLKGVVENIKIWVTR